MTKLNKVEIEKKGPVQPRDPLQITLAGQGDDEVVNFMLSQINVNDKSSVIGAYVDAIVYGINSINTKIAAIEIEKEIEETEKNKLEE